MAAAAGDDVEIETEPNKCACVVCALIITGFSTLSFADKLQIIAKGRAKPPMKNLATKMKNCTRHFYPEKSYEQFKWLTGCGNRGKLFCWPCLLFENDRGLWNKGGFADLNNFHKAVKRHYTSKAHLINVVKEKLFGKSKTDSVINAQLKLSNRQHNELVDKNRVMLRRLVDVVCFRGQGNFQELVRLLAKYDDCLKNHLNSSSDFRDTLNQTRNDLMSAVATVIIKRIKHEISNSQFIAIILDDAFSQLLSAVIRYVKTDGTVQERFLGFYNVSGDRTADALYDVICEIVKEVEGGTKLVAQSYDGSIVMPKHLGRLQAKIRGTFPSAVFANCHKLDLVLFQALNHIGECKGFFAALSGIAEFFSQSQQRSQFRATVCKKTNWNYGGALVATVSEHRESLREFFENIIENSEKWDADTINGAIGFLYCLNRDFGFNFLLNVFSVICPFIDEVFDALQTETNDISLRVNKVNEFQYLLKQIRTEFSFFWEKTMVDTMNEVSTKYEFFQTTFFEIIDQIIEQTNCRFNDLSDFKFLELCNFNAYKTRPFPEEALKSLLSRYGPYFDKALLRTELTVVYTTDDIGAKSDANELMHFLKDSGLEDAYTEVLKLCELALTIPLTEMSTPQRVKKFVKNNQMSLLSIENQLLRNLSEERDFYDDVIDEFAKTMGDLNYYYITDSTPATPKPKKNEPSDRPDLVSIQMLRDANEEEEEETEVEESEIKIEMDEMDVEEAALLSINKEESDREMNGAATHSTNSHVEEPDQESSAAARHPLQIFFDSMACTAMSFPPPLAVRAKTGVLEVISKLELEMWNQSE